MTRIRVTYLRWLASVTDDLFASAVRVAILAAPIVAAFALAL